MRKHAWLFAHSPATVAAASTKRILRRLMCAFARFVQPSGKVGTSFVICLSSPQSSVRVKSHQLGYR